jgi:hypothetical protein
MVKIVDPFISSEVLKNQNCKNDFQKDLTVKKRTLKDEQLYETIYDQFPNYFKT